MSRRNDQLMLHRDRDLAGALAYRAHDALTTDNISVRHGGVQVAEVPFALALGALLVSARPGQSGFEGQGATQRTRSRPGRASPPAAGRIAPGRVAAASGSWLARLSGFAVFVGIRSL